MSYRFIVVNRAANERKPQKDAERGERNHRCNLEPNLRIGQ